MTLPCGCWGCWVSGRGRKTWSWSWPLLLVGEESRSRTRGRVEDSKWINRERSYCCTCSSAASTSITMNENSNPPTDWGMCVFSYSRHSIFICRPLPHTYSCISSRGVSRIFTSLCHLLTNISCKNTSRAGRVLRSAAGEDQESAGSRLDRAVVVSALRASAGRI